MDSTESPFFLEAEQLRMSVVVTTMEQADLNLVFEAEPTDHSESQSKIRLCPTSIGHPIVHPSMI